MLTEQDKKDMLNCMLDAVENKAVGEFEWYNPRLPYADHDKNDTEIVTELSSGPSFKVHPKTGCDTCDAVVRVLIPTVDPGEGKMYFLQ